MQTWASSYIWDTNFSANEKRIAKRIGNKIALTASCDLDESELVELSLDAADSIVGTGTSANDRVYERYMRLREAGEHWALFQMGMSDAERADFGYTFDAELIDILNS